MTIDEAIQNLKYDIEIDMYIRDIAPQIAEWLEELKAIKSNGRYVQGNKAGQKIGYNKAIDDFKSRLEERILAGKMIDEKFAYIDNCDIDEIAEQLKAGGENDNLRR